MKIILAPTQVQYLYAYSYLKDFVKINPDSREAFDYFKGQAAKYWTDQNKYIQGMIAIALVSTWKCPAHLWRSSIH